MARFLIGLFLIAVLLLLLLWWGQAEGWWAMPSFSKEIILVMALLTAILFFYLRMIRARQPGIFNMFYLLSIAIKLMAGLSFIGYVVWSDRAAAAGNALLFVVSYSLFTFLEVYFLVVRKE